MKQVMLDIIYNAGEAKALAYEALNEAKVERFDKAEKLLKKSDDLLLKANSIEHKIIQEEAAGNNIEVTILMVHAQDHLMTAIEAKNLIEGIIDFYKIKTYSDSSYNPI